MSIKIRCLWNVSCNLGLRWFITFLPNIIVSFCVRVDPIWSDVEKKYKYSPTILPNGDANSYAENNKSSSEEDELTSYSNAEQ